ncbi:hypothetical protein ILUMI_18927, partial [Ignelater luminosus]
MGNATKREKEGARGAQKLYSKRKSRRNIALRMQKTKWFVEYFRTQELCNENVEDTNKFDVNSAITLAAISTGIGYSQIEEVAAGLNMPIMSDKTYQKCHEKVAVAIRQTAWDIMEKAGKKEAELPRQLGE